jgi:nitrate reductase molybdenum cofactor assembly chaperone NarJ/NarW
MSRIDALHRSVTMAVVSQALQYPDAALGSQLPVLRDAAAGLPSSIGEPLDRLLDWLSERTLLELQAAYVATFDLRRRNALYLTYHLNGDTRRRGEAIRRFGELYRSRGYAMAAPELSDFLPAVLELAAECPPTDSGVLEALIDHMPSIIALRRSLEDDGSPWAHAVRSLELVLPPPTPSAHEVAERLIMAGPPVEEVGLDPYTLPGMEVRP